MAFTHVAHDCRVGSKCVMANYATLAGHVELGDWVIMGGYAGTHQFTKVGAHAFIGNNAAVTRDVPPYVMAVGTPAVPHSINSEGLKRRGFTPEQIRNLKNAYRVLYRSDLKLADAVAELQSRVADAAGAEDIRRFHRRVHAQSRALRGRTPVRIALVAGETSGDTLGAALHRGIAPPIPTSRIRGCRRPEDEGCRLRRVARHR